MTRALAAAYLTCLFFAGLPDPFGLIFAVLGTLSGVLALTFALCRPTKGSAPHA